MIYSWRRYYIRCVSCDEQWHCIYLWSIVRERGGYFIFQCMFAGALISNYVTSDEKPGLWDMQRLINVGVYTTGCIVVVYVVGRALHDERRIRDIELARRLLHKPKDVAAE